MRLVVTLVVLAACTRTTSFTMSRATAKLECIDCDRQLAIGLPARVVSSWVGSCRSEGYTAFFHEDKETGGFEWVRTPFSQTKACDEHTYKIAVKCSSKCVIRAMDSPDTSTVKLLGVYPQNTGSFKFSVEIRTKQGDVVAQFASTEMLVRAPDEISLDERERRIDGPSRLAIFAGHEYFLEPGSARAAEPPNLGTMYKPEEPPPAPDAAEQSRPETPTRLDRVCRARTPGAIAWRPCTQGIHAGDDVRLDVTAWLGTVRMSGDVSLIENGGEVQWTCYRSKFASLGNQICMRYGIPAGKRALTWKGLGYSFDETLSVEGAP